METLKKLVHRVVYLIPHSNSLVKACQIYCQRFQEPSYVGSVQQPGYENNADINTNGELRLLQEVAVDISVAFDVGANVGEWTELVLSLSPNISCVYAFEPGRSAYTKLINHSFPTSVNIQNIGLSSGPGKSSLFIFGDAAGVNSLHNRHGLEDGWGICAAETTEEVTLETIDRFCEKHSIKRVDYLKIDTEGHEVDVLEGAKESLKAGAMKIIQFEYGGTYIDSRRLLKDVFEIMTTLDYTIFLITPDRLIAYPRYDQRLENFQYKNFVIFHNSLVEKYPSTQKALQLLHRDK